MDSRGAVFGVVQLLSRTIGLGIAAITASAILASATVKSLHYGSARAVRLRLERDQERAASEATAKALEHDRLRQQVAADAAAQAAKDRAYYETDAGRRLRAREKADRDALARNPN